MSREKFTPDDVIAGMLSFVKVRFLDGSQQGFQEVIYEMRESYPLLKIFTFSKEGVYPFSSLLEQVLARMELSHLIRTYGPDFKKYIINKKAQGLVREDLKEHFNVEEIGQLKAMAEELEIRCKVP